MVDVGRYARHVGILEILRKSNGWLNHSSEKYAQVKLKHFPQIGMKIKLFETTT